MAFYENSATGNICDAAGLRDAEREQLRRLMTVWMAKQGRNRLRRDFYNMHVMPTNLGISLSDDMVRKLNVACGWPAKSVDLLADRSILDAFVFEDGQENEELSRLMDDNNIYAKYDMATRSELTHSVVFWTLSRGRVGRSKVRIKLHSAESAAAIWDGYEERIECGMAIIDTTTDKFGTGRIPSVVNLYCADHTVVLRRSITPTGDDWSAEYVHNPLGRPAMEQMAFMPSIHRPFGRSRISRAVMSLTMSKLRSDMRGEIAAEIISTPQKYLLGADDEAFDMDRYLAYIGNIFLASKDEDGDVPTFGQLAQGSMQPQVDYTRMLAAQFAGETSIPISSLGVIHDQPASAEAMRAAERDLVQLAEKMNRTNGEALRNVALMAMALGKGAGASLDKLDDNEWTVQADFADPSKPDVVSTADAWTKMASAAPYIGETEEFLEANGVSKTKRMRMLAQRRRIKGQSFMEASDGNVGTGGADGLLGLSGTAGGSLARVRVAGVEETPVGSQDGGIVS